MTGFRLENWQTPVYDGVPLREIAPSTNVGIFIFTFAAAPVASQFVAPGNSDQQALVTEKNWVLYTRSVASWWIRAEPDKGGTLIVWIGSRMLGAGALWFWPWLAVALDGEDTPNVCSGLELPGAMFARFEILNADEAVGPHVFSGSIMLRGV